MPASSKVVILLWCLAVGAFSAVSASAQTMGGGELPEPTDRASQEIDALFPGVVARARQMGIEPPADTVKPQVVNRNAAVKLQHPLRLRPKSERFLSNGISNHVDHDATAGLKDFACGTRTYDGHRGIDMSLGVFSWRTMDGGEVEVVAAAAGTIVDKVNGQYDRQCNWTSAPANYVILRQADGLFAMYWHLKNNSVTAKSIGQTVEAGEYLGLVGSSGNSNGPHLHFELREVQGNGSTKVETYAGTCSVPASTVSLWKHQHEAIDSEITRVATHAAAPPSITYPNPSPNFCGADGKPINPDPRYSDQFAPGATAYIAVYLKDQQAAQRAKLDLYRPSGTVYLSSESGSPPSGFYSNSYWYWSVVLPSDASANGVWRARFTFNGQSREHAFQVGGTVPANAVVRALVDPQARSPRANVANLTTLFAKNASAVEAIGCWVAPDHPLAGTFSFRTLGATGVPTGAINQSFSIPARGTRNLQLTFRGAAGTTANDIEVPVRVSCINSVGPAVTSGYNTLRLSFRPTATPDITFTNPLSPTFIASLPSAASAKNIDFVATNSGAAGTQVVKPYPIGTMPLTLRICELNASNACIAPFAVSVSKTFAAAGTAKFRVRVASSGAVALNELLRRVVLEARDAGAGARNVRGQTSFAVRTLP